MKPSVLITLLVLASTATASGEVLTASFSGVITNDLLTDGQTLADPWNEASVVEGQPWSATFTYDTRIAPDSGNGPFDTATLEASLTFGGVTQRTPDASISYSDDFLHGTLSGNVLADSYLFRAFFGNSLFDIRVTTQPDVIDGPELPTALSLGDLIDSNIRLAAQLETPPPPTPNASFGFSGSLTSIAVVPEPASLVLMASALAVLAAQRRPNHRLQLTGDARGVKFGVVDEPPTRAAGN